MVDPISNYEYSPQAEQNPSAAVYEGLAAACWAPQDTTATNSTATADNASPAERIITSATNNEKPEWKKGEPDRVRSDASAPSREEKDKALEKAKEMFKIDLAANLYEDLVKGNMGHFGLMMHDLRHNYPSGVKGVGMKELQAEVEELNKVLRYPIEIVTGEGEPPELGLKFKPYHYERPRDNENPNDFFGHGEKMSLTIWSYGKYEATSQVSFGRSMANLPAGMTESEQRLQRMLVSSVLNHK